MGGRVQSHPIAESLKPKVHLVLSCASELHLQPENVCLMRRCDHIQVDVIETARMSRTSTSEELLRRIATLLFMLVTGLLTVFACYASWLCITVVLAAFLAILVDTLVVML